jgi:hypothetical protein
MRIRVDATSLRLPGAGVRNYVHYWLRSPGAAAAQRGDEVDTHSPGLRTDADLDHNRSVCGVVGTRAGGWGLAILSI